MDTLMLVDMFSPVPEGFMPELAEVRGMLLEREAASACRKMIEAAEKGGVGIRIISGYRTADYQRMLWDRSVRDYISCGLTADEAESLTARYLALPGHSEHETGLACDLSTPDSSDTREDLAGTPAGTWLCRHAAEYGFILRYPRMKEHITGFSYEPWHYRYVGLPHSADIRAGGLTLEEYLHYRSFRPCQ